MKKIAIFLYILLFFTQIGHAQLDSMSFTPVKDNSMFSESPTYSDGAGSNLYAGKTNGIGMRRALIKFGLTGLPANAQIQSVRLKMSVINASTPNKYITHNFSLHKLLKNWGEGTSNSTGSGSPATINDATWQYNLYSSSSWTTPGGDFIPTASATSGVTFADYPLQFGTWSSASMKTDVINWLASPASNFGWILIGEESTTASAKKFSSRQEGLYPIPTLTIFYMLPAVDKVLINEVNPNKKWIELYNPSSPSVNLSSYYMANGGIVETLANMTILNGNLQLDAGKYVVLNWANISQSNGELALFNGNPSNNASIMKDYVQYGAGNHTRAGAAVTAQVWDNVNIFLPTVTADSMTYSLNGNNTYASGQATNSTSFVIQRQTPTYINTPCSATVSLLGNVVDATYSTTGLLQLTGTIGITSMVKFSSQNYVFLQPNTQIQSGAKFEAKIGGCPAN